jgi:hypothetical protein
MVDVAAAASELEHLADDIAEALGDSAPNAGSRQRTPCSELPQRGEPEKARAG